MPGLNTISPENLMRQLGHADSPLLFDFCIDEAFNEDPRLIPGSTRLAHDRLSDMIESLRGQRVVAICQKGKKLGAGSAAFLRAEGVEAEYLEGGIHAWRDAGLPLVPVSAHAGIAQGGTLWVTRQRPKIDRIACPWLIRRFVDRKARFLFVPAVEVEAVAERFGATPFDMEGGFWSHRGPNCSFDTMLEEFALQTPALARLAEVIRAADTNRHEDSPQAAGLLAMSVGLSRLYRDDNRQLDAAMPLYDALYRWARDGYEEGHDWPLSAKEKRAG